MTTTKMAAALPKGDGNGLNAIAHRLLADQLTPTAGQDGRPHLYAVIALVDSGGVATKPDAEWTVTARVRRVEVVLPADCPTAEKLLRRALENRTGLETLPLELEDELNAAFDNIDLTTGELRHPPEQPPANPSEPPAE